MRNNNRWANSNVIRASFTSNIKNNFDHYRDSKTKLDLKAKNCTAFISIGLLLKKNENDPAINYIINGKWNRTNFEISRQWKIKFKVDIGINLTESEGCQTLVYEKTN